MDNTDTVTYSDKISTMMFAFGDNQIPNTESVKLVESVVFKQLQEIIQEADKNASRCNIKTINAEDIIFLLRHDRHKMQRFVKYLDYKYVDLPTIQSTGKEKTPRKKMKLLRNFIGSIDETGEFLDSNEFDDIKYERQIRAERISSALDEDKYKEYAKARQASFLNKKYSNTTKFRMWIDPQHEFILSKEAVDVLEVLAYGIIGHVVDMALIVRQNTKRISTDPLRMLSGSFYNTSMFTAPHVSQSDSLLPQIGQVPITPAEIREVVRRCYMPQVGYIKFSNKSMLGKRKLFLY